MDHNLDLALSELRDVVKVVGRDDEGNLIFSCPPEVEFTFLSLIEEWKWL